MGSRTAGQTALTFELRAEGQVKRLRLLGVDVGARRVFHERRP